MNAVHNVKMIQVCMPSFTPQEDQYAKGLGTLASGVRMGEEAASWRQFKKDFCDFFFFFFFFKLTHLPPICIAYLHIQECEGSVEYNYIIIPKF